MDKARKLGLAVFGSGVGGLFLWLAIRKVDVAAVLQIAGEIDTRAVITAVALYWVAMVGRSRAIQLAATVGGNPE